MPTDAEIDAAMQVTNEWSDMSRAERREFAIDVLAAAEAVRAQANECHALDRDYPTICQCSHCRAYRAGRSDTAFDAAEAHRPAPGQRQTFVGMNGARGTMTHDPLLGWVVDPDLTCLETMTEAELLAGLEPYLKDCDCQICRDYRAITPQCIAKPTSATSGPQTADTQSPRQDYHTSAIPGDGDEERITIRTAAEIEAERIAWKAAVAAHTPSHDVRGAEAGTPAPRPNTQTKGYPPPRRDGR